MSSSDASRSSIVMQTRMSAPRDKARLKIIQEQVGHEHAPRPQSTRASARTSAPHAAPASGWHRRRGAQTADKPGHVGLYGLQGSRSEVHETNEAAGPADSGQRFPPGTQRPRDIGRSGGVR